MSAPTKEGRARREDPDEEEDAGGPPKHLRLLIACKTGHAASIDAALAALERDPDAADDALIARDPQ